MDKGDKLGRYVLGEPIGKGAMSEVFASRHPLLERNVAIKVLKKEVCSDQQYVARFLDDARAAHGLNHPNIVRVLDVDDTAAQPFIVMDLVKGRPLDEWRAGQVDLPVAMGIARDVASALAAAHAGGLIHRDVKPSNVLMEDGTGSAKLTDFGAAKREREEGQELTQMGQRIGTPRYMAPEQVEGKPVSARTDLFALGALVYELLAGRPAFEGESVGAVYHSILLKEPPPLTEVRSDLPPELTALVARLLAKKPEDRPENAEEVVAILDQLTGRTSSLGTTAYPAAAATTATATGGADRTAGSGANATVIGAGDTSPQAPGQASGPTGGTPPPPPKKPDRASGGWGGSKLVPIAAGVAGLIVVLGGVAWLFSGSDEPAQTEVVAAADDEPAEATDQAAEPGEEQPPAVEEPVIATGDAGANGEEAAAPGDEPAMAAASPAREEEPAQEEEGADEVASEPATGEEVTDQPVTAAAGGDAAPDAEAGEESAGGASADASADDQQPAEQPAAPAQEEAPTFAQSMQTEPEQDAASDEAASGGDQTEQEVAALPREEQGADEQAAANGAGAPSVELPPLECSADEPGCQLTETVVAAVEPAAGQPEVTLNKEDGVYLDQEYLVAEVAMPEDLGGYLYLDVYTDNGEVFHLLPEPLRQDNELVAGGMIRVGVEEDERATGVRHWQISEPFSVGYLVALVSEKRLFPNLRPIGESIETYRPALLEALEDAGRVTYSVTPVEFRAR